MHNIESPMVGQAVGIGLFRNRNVFLNKGKMRKRQIVEAGVAVDTLAHIAGA